MASEDFDCDVLVVGTGASGMSCIAPIGMGRQSPGVILRCWPLTTTVAAPSSSSQNSWQS